MTLNLGEGHRPTPHKVLKVLYLNDKRGLHASDKRPLQLTKATPVLCCAVFINTKFLNLGVL
jgi:hypothetical protein